MILIIAEKETVYYSSSSWRESMILIIDEARERV